MNFYYTYALVSKKDGDFYIGYTSNLESRFEDHSKGYVSSTKDRLPMKLIYYEACRTKADALKREKYLKTYHGRFFLKKRLKSYFMK